MVTSRGNSILHFFMLKKIENAVQLMAFTSEKFNARCREGMEVESNLSEALIDEKRTEFLCTPGQPSSSLHPRYIRVSPDTPDAQPLLFPSWRKAVVKQ